MTKEAIISAIFNVCKNVGLDYTTKVSLVHLHIICYNQRLSHILK